MAVRSADDDVPLEPGVSDLAGDVGVGAADNQPVLGGVVFVLVLDDQTLAGVVVGSSLSPPAELDLIPLEVGLILDNLDERHLDLQVFSANISKCNIFNHKE